jgi:hypothetical protein
MRAAACLFLIAALSACSNENKSSTAPDTQAATAAEAAASAGSRACDVLTQEAAAKALGRDVQKLDNQGGASGQDICQYGYQGERIADAGNVSVTVHPVDLESVISGAKAQGYVLEPVAALGDGAFYSSDVGLYVGKGQRTAHYLLAANGMDDPRGKVIALAQETVERL